MTLGPEAQIGCWYQRLSPYDVEVLAELISIDADFVVVGGTAACFHNCRLIENVDDLDILLRPAMEDARAVAKVVEDITCRHGSATVVSEVNRLARPRVQFPMKRGVFYIEFLTAESVSEFDEFLDRSIRTQLGSLTVRVISREDLITMKRRAVDHSEQNDKHNLDLRCLQKINSGSNAFNSSP